MPRTTSRPALLADAAVRVLATAGIHRLTHRGVDAEAGVPAGTASNHFRSRHELLMATARRLLELHVAALDAAFAGATARTWDETVAAIASMTTAADTDEEARTRYLAYAELLLEAPRFPELAPIVGQIRDASVRHAATLIRAAGIAVGEATASDLAALLTGLTLERISLGVTGSDPEALVGRLLAASGPPPD